MGVLTLDMPKKKKKKKKKKKMMKKKQKKMKKKKKKMKKKKKKKKDKKKAAYDDDPPSPKSNKSRYDRKDDARPPGHWGPVDPSPDSAQASAGAPRSSGGADPLAAAPFTATPPAPRATSRESSALAA